MTKVRRERISAPGQAPLPDMSGATPPHFAKHISVMRYFAERGDALLGQGFDVDAITESMIRAADPDNFALSLKGDGVVLDRNMKGKYGVSYVGEDGSHGRVALSGGESKIFRDNVRAYGKGVYRKVETSPHHQLANDPDPDAPFRAIGHVLSADVDGMRHHAVNVLGDQQRLLGHFSEALRYPKLARFGGEIPIRIAGALLEQEIIGTMLDALEDQRSWTPEKRELASKTIMAKMYILRQGDENLIYARRLFTVNRLYITAKQNAFLGRVAAANAYIKENTPVSG